MGRYSLWIYLQILFLVAIFAEKERVEEQQIAQITDKLFHVLEKRINEWDLDENDALEDCSFQFSNESIIRTRDSIEAGATFIKSPVVQSRESCQEICCDIANCNLAVYKEKVNENACYLFDCGTPSVCQFTGHPGFIAMEMPSRQTTNKQQAKHEKALESLAATTESTSTTSEPTTTTTSTTTESTTTSTTTSTQSPVTEPEVETKPVPLFGECESHKDCAGSWTECLAGYCVCQEGYHAQDGICQHDKVNGDESSESEVANSADKSEEDSKEKLTDDQQNEQVLLDIIKYLHSGTVGSSLSKALDSESHSNEKTDDINANNVKNIKLTGKSTVPPFAVKPGKDNTDDKDKNSDESNDDIDDDKQEVDIQQQQDQIPQKKDESLVTVEKQPKTNVIPQLPMAPADDEKDITENGQSIEVDEVEETAIYISTSQKNRGAVIALALGLAVTALLLLFVGCRLRNMKRRLRKGRPMNSNEADYLINGMYL